MKFRAIALCGMYLRVLLTLFLLAGAFSIHAASNNPALRASTRDASEKVLPLTHVMQVRRLSREQAAQSLPIRIKGIVTDLPGYKNSFFLQDETGGISVDRTDSARVSAGDLVEVIGVTNPGLFAPSLMVARVSVLGHGPPPLPKRVSYDDMVGGAQDSQWIEVHGVVRSARISKTFEDDVLILVVDLGGASTRVIVQDFARINSVHLIDSTVRIRGVCTSNFNNKRQFVGLEMYVPDSRDLDIVRAADDPFLSPVIAVRNALQFGRSQHRIRISGVATYQIPGHTLYIQDGSDGIAVQTSAKELITPGTKVDAVGFPAIGEYAPVLEDGIVRMVGHTSPPTPLRTDAQNVILSGKAIEGWDASDYAPYDQQLLELRGRVVENHLQGAQRVWILRQQSAVFEAYLPIAMSDNRMAKIATGSAVSIVGICLVHADSERAPVSFSILVRSPQDIVILQQAPWWTPARTFSLLAALAVLTVLVTLWLLVLRKRVEQQTRTIRESEGRFRYLAEHDELTGLLNRRAVLLALEREIVRASRDKTAVTIVLGDLDHFKQVNDIHGHLAGDAALRRFAAALSESMRPYDSAGRYGGEEFLLVLPGITTGDAKDRLSVLHETISNLTVQDRQAEFRITCSLGAVVIAGTGAFGDQDAALAAADRALYEAKDTGRNRVVLHSLGRDNTYDAFPQVLVH